MENKYLEKVAAIYDNLQKGYNTIVRRSSNKVINQSIAGGAAVGSGLGYAGSKKVTDYDKNGNLRKRDATTGERIWGAVGGGIAGAAIGSTLGGAAKIRGINDKLYGKGKFKFGQEQTKHGKKFEDLFTKARNKSQKQYESKGPRYTKRGINEILKDLQAPPGGFKTKAEAKSHFRRAAMKNHPDRGGDVEAMKKINTAFEEFQKHPDGFEKLAGYKYLSRIIGK